LSTRRFRVDPQRVVHETIDAETIIIHLKTGSYFSLSGVAPEVWSLAVAGCSEDAAVAEVARRYEDAADAADTARAFLRELVREELLEEAPDAGEEPRHVELPSPGPFEAPVLRKFTDLQYFLLLDPIHEVEAAGWPHERDAVPAAK
jgi:hypothetical protein